MLRIEHFSKIYTGGHKAVDDLNLHVQPGRIYGFIGHNGAGKTTTLRAAAGVMDFTEGRILIDGHDIVREPVEAKKVTAFLPDNPDLYPFMTGIRFLNFIADLYEIPGSERTQRIEKYADAFELTGNLGSLISSYSHGMRQKLALISAFMRQPKLMLLDEPMVGLDPTSAHTMKEFLAELCREGSSVFFSTHVLEVAERLCDEVAIIKHGRLIRSGLTAEIVGDSSLEDVFLELESEPDAAEREK